MASEPRNRPLWRERNFISEVLIPSFFTQRTGSPASNPPLFPPVKKHEFCLTWIGHASFLLQTRDQNILIDPNWANWLAVIKRLRHAGMEIDHLPDIDLVLITHAHFDHLNRTTLRKVARNQPIVVPRGVASLVHNLGFEQIHEMEWWDRWQHGDLEIIFTPAKHWGARQLIDQNRGYGGYILGIPERRLYVCGDSAWFDGFRKIGKNFQPDIAVLPIGAYDNPSGRDHHISPEEAVRAFIDLKAKTLIPMHFGTYRMSYEPLDEPPQRLMKAAAEAGCLSHIHFLTEGLPEIF